MFTPEITPEHTNQIQAQLREADRYANEFQLEGLDQFNPHHADAIRKHLALMETQQQVHRPMNGRTPGKWTLGPAK